MNEALKHTNRILASGLYLAVLLSFVPASAQMLAPASSNSSSSSAATSGWVDIRKIAPPTPVDDDPTGGLVMPTSGHDFTTVSQDWANKQIDALTGGYQQKLVDRINRSINKNVDSIIHPAKVGPDGKPLPLAAANDRAPANINGHSVAAAPSEPASNFGVVRFATINRFEVGVGGSNNISCLIKTDSLEWDYSHRLTDSIDLNVRHETREAASTIRLHYNW